MFDAITDYFANIPSSHRSAILVGGLTIFWMIENALPLFAFPYNKWKHASINIFFTITTIVVNFSMAFILVSTADYVADHNIGLLQIVTLPLWAQLIIGLLLMDLIGAWCIHWLQHKIKWMWKFHVIHHTDQEIDTTSANRHHPGESVFRFIFTTIAILIVGSPMWLVFLYQSMSLILTQFNHANIKMSYQLDRVLSTVFCTPNMHHVHHHYRQPYTDTNYGNIFSFWDRIFGTYIEVDNKVLKYGLDTHMEKTQNIPHLLAIPFLPYRQAIPYDKEEKLDTTTR